METPQLNFSQQFKLLNPETVRPVTLIGAGAVGSWVAVALAKMGVPLTIWDDDDVSEHNVPMSAYGPSDFMRPKVAALAAIVKAASGLEIKIRRERYADAKLEGVVVLCVDSMEARQSVWKQIRNNPEVDLLVDTRTAGQLLWVFAVSPCDPDDVDYYDGHVSYGSREAEEHFCGLHGFMPMSFRAAGAVGSALTSWWMKGTKKLHHKELVVELDNL